MAGHNTILKTDIIIIPALTMGYFTGKNKEQNKNQRYPSNHIHVQPSTASMADKLINDNNKLVAGAWVGTGRYLYPCHAAS